MERNSGVSNLRTRGRASSQYVGQVLYLRRHNSRSYVDMTSWKELTPEDIARWSQKVVSKHAVIDDFSIVTFTEHLRSLIGLRRRQRHALGSFSVADGMESFSLRDYVHERAEVLGVGRVD